MAPGRPAGGGGLHRAGAAPGGGPAPRRGPGGVETVRSQVLTFSHQPHSGASTPLGALRAIQAIGAGTSRKAAPLPPGAWRKLLAAWPQGGQLSWEVLLLLAQKSAPPAHPGDPPCSW